MQTDLTRREFIPGGAAGVVAMALPLRGRAGADEPAAMPFRTEERLVTAGFRGVAPDARMHSQ